MLLNQSNAELRSFIGAQEELVFASVPATSARKIGERIRGATLDVAGTYTAAFLVAGWSDVECHVRASSITGSCTTDVYTTYADGSTKKTSFTGVGALVANTRQSTTFTGTKGVQQAILSLVVVTGPTVIDQCEINGA